MILLFGFNVRSDHMAASLFLCIFAPDFRTNCIFFLQIRKDAFMKGTYMGISMSGSGPMDLIATKKE